MCNMTKPIKILQIFGSLDVGGAESRMMDIYRHIDKEKYQFDFLTMQKGKQYFESEIIAMGGRIFKVDPPRKNGLIRNLKNMVDVIKKSGPYSAVHAHTSYHCGLAMLAAKISNVNIRISHSRTINSKNNGLKTLLMMNLGKILIKLFATEKLAISKNAAMFLYGMNYFKKNRDCVIPNAIDTDKYFVKDKLFIDSIRENYFLKNKFLIIGHVGRFESIKNHSFLINILIETIKVNSNTVLIMIGDGPKKNEIAKLISEKKLENNVIFLGIRNDVNIWMNVFDVVILPSIYEGLCSSAIESQAAGVPCILSKGIPGDADLGLGLTKFLSLDDSVDDWVKAIFEMKKTRICNIDYIRSRFNENGYSIKSVVEKLKIIYGRKV